jgi:hypothetical protein
MGAIGWVVCTSLLASLPAHAGNAHVFPVPSHLVAGAVVAAFILPAAIASVLSVIRRIGRSPIGLLGLCVVAGGALAAIGYVNPDLIASLRI